MLRYFIIVIICYLLVRFIFGFVIPVATAALNMRRKMREMQNQMNGFGPQHSESNTPNNQSTGRPTSKPSSSDYIDFEEVK